MKADEKKLEDILVINLVPNAMPIAKSPYRLAPTEIHEMSNQLKELKDKDYHEQNELTVKNRYPLPRIDDLFNQLQGSCEIRYHPGKASVVADALSMKEWMKPRRDRAISMMILSSIKARTLEAHSEAFKDINTPTGML
uniref:Putative reverse transcriptase domain-containing protein n=1 Tax=Tanacetum cinerariifolium TaxID=118510 RepID=A0A699JNZ2_TANCI|nr:putative reverse transcriptase domain-containing protein [Tanacetum cinerariifolium]